MAPNTPSSTTCKWTSLNPIVCALKHVRRMTSIQRLYHPSPIVLPGTQTSKHVHISSTPPRAESQLSHTYSLSLSLSTAQNLYYYVHDAHSAYTDGRSAFRLARRARTHKKTTQKLGDRSEFVFFLKLVEALLKSRSLSKTETHSQQKSRASSGILRKTLAADREKKHLKACPR